MQLAVSYGADLVAARQQNRYLGAVKANQRYQVHNANMPRQLRRLQRPVQRGEDRLVDAVGAGVDDQSSKEPVECGQ